MADANDTGSADLFRRCALLTALTATLALRWLVTPTRAADYQGNLEAAGRYAAAAVRLGPMHEPASHIYFNVNTWLAGDVAGGILVSSIVTTAVLLTAFVGFSLRSRTPGAPLLLVWGLAAPLLAINTLRATPAYLLCSAAVLSKSPISRRSFVLTAVAVGFHRTALIPLAVITCVLIVRLYAKSRRVALLLALFLLAPVAQTSRALADRFASATPTEHFVFRDAFSVQQTAYVLLLFVSLAWLALHANTSAQRAYFLIYMVIHAGLVFSAASTFRVSLFWIIPTLFDIRKFSPPRWTYPLMAFASIGIFALGSITAG